MTPTIDKRTAADIINSAATRVENQWARLIEEHGAAAKVSASAPGRWQTRCARPIGRPMIYGPSPPGPMSG